MTSVVWVLCLLTLATVRAGEYCEDFESGDFGDFWSPGTSDYGGQWTPSSYSDLKQTIPDFPEPASGESVVYLTPAPSSVYMSAQLEMVNSYNFPEGSSLSFRYWLRSQWSGSGTFEVRRIIGSGDPETIQSLTTTSGPDNADWMEANVTIPNNDKSFKLLVFGACGTGEMDNIAIDDIKVCGPDGLNQKCLPMTTTTTVLTTTAEPTTPTEPTTTPEPTTPEPTTPEPTTPEPTTPEPTTPEPTTPEPTTPEPTTPEPITPEPTTTTQQTTTTKQTEATTTAESTASTEPTTTSDSTPTAETTSETGPTTSVKPTTDSTGPTETTPAAAPTTTAEMSTSNEPTPTPKSTSEPTSEPVSTANSTSTETTSSVKPVASTEASTPSGKTTASQPATVSTIPITTTPQLTTTAKYTTYNPITVTEATKSTTAIPATTETPPPPPTVLPPTPSDQRERLGPSGLLWAALAVLAASVLLLLMLALGQRSVRARRTDQLPLVRQTSSVGFESASSSGGSSGWFDYLLNDPWMHLHKTRHLRPQERS